MAQLGAGLLEGVGAELSGQGHMEFWPPDLASSALRTFAFVMNPVPGTYASTETFVFFAFTESIH